MATSPERSGKIVLSSNESEVMVRPALQNALLMYPEAQDALTLNGSIQNEIKTGEGHIDNSELIGEIFQK